MLAGGLLVGSVRAYPQESVRATEHRESIVDSDAVARGSDEPGRATESEAAASPGSRTGGIAWSPVIAEGLMFLTLQHSMRMTNHVMRSNLKGPFVSDWFDSVSSIDRFDDNGKILTNWIAHPMQGSVSAFILGQNDPTYVSASPGSSRYWRAKRRQLLFATVYSVQFELGPYSESSLGNIHQGGIDLVLTPTLGTLWSIGEDVAAQRLIAPLRAGHPKWANTLAILLNPTRSLANVLAFKRPWACDVGSCRSPRPAAPSDR